MSCDLHHHPGQSYYSSAGTAVAVSGNELNVVAQKIREAQRHSIEAISMAHPSGLQLTTDSIEKLWIHSEGADKPSEHAVMQALLLVREVEEISPSAPAATDIEGFEGDVLLHWNFGPRSISLVCPADRNRSIKLYKETVVDGRAATTGLINSPSASIVTANLRWIRQKN